MNTHRRAMLSAAVLPLLCHAAAAAPPGDAQAVFDSLYAQPIRQARQSASKQDDIALAERMVDAVIAEDLGATLTKLICDAAYDLSLDARGYGAAEKAMVQLADQVPIEAAHADARLLALYQRWLPSLRYGEQARVGDKLIDAADRVAAQHLADHDPKAALVVLNQATAVARRVRSSKLAALNQRIDQTHEALRIERLIAGYEQRLAANPKDHGSGAALCKLYLVQHDDPVKAATVADHVDDKAFAAMVRLAAQPVERVPADKLVPLGDWYRGLAGDAAEPRARPLRVRAKACYEAFLVATPEDAEGLGRSKATLALRQVDRELGLTGDTIAIADDPVPVKKQFDWPAYYAQRDRATADEKVALILSMLRDSNDSQQVRIEHEFENGKLATLEVQRGEDIEDIRALAGIRIRSLSLSRCKRIRDFGPLADAQVQRLNLDGCANMTSIAFVSKMPLSRLSMAGCWNVRSLAPLAGCKQLTELNIERCDGLRSLRGLEGLPLVRLNMEEADNVRGDLSELASAKLTYLNVSRCHRLSGLNGVARQPITQLVAEELRAIGPDLVILKAMPLKHLNLSECEGVKSLNGLQGMPLEWLNVWTRRPQLGESDLEILRTLRNLKALATHQPGWNQKLKVPPPKR